MIKLPGRSFDREVLVLAIHHMHLPVLLKNRQFHVHDKHRLGELVEPERLAQSLVMND